MCVMVERNITESSNGLLEQFLQEKIKTFVASDQIGPTNLNLRLCHIHGQVRDDYLGRSRASRRRRCLVLDLCLHSWAGTTTTAENRGTRGTACSATAASASALGAGSNDLCDA